MRFKAVALLRVDTYYLRAEFSLPPDHPKRAPIPKKPARASIPLSSL